MHLKLTMHFFFLSAKYDIMSLSETQKTIYRLYLYRKHPEKIQTFELVPDAEEIIHRLSKIHKKKDAAKKKKLITKFLPQIDKFKSKYKGKIFSFTL